MIIWNEKANLKIPSTVNSTDNVLSRDVLGRKDDTHAGTSLMAFSDRINEHFHSSVKVYPTLAAGVVVTTAVAAWTLGAYVVVVPANTIAADFDIHHINVSAWNANDTFELVLYAGPNGGEVEIGRVRLTRLSNVGASPHIPFQTPLIAANSQIKAKLASQAGTSNTVTMSIMYHNY
jgi:hypothetical protein